MTTIVDMTSRFKSHPKRVMDSRDEFMSKTRNSQVITYSLEHFTSCFLNDPQLLKAIHVRLYNFKEDQRPEAHRYFISWDDIPRDEDEDWHKFQRKVDFQLKEFLTELKVHSNVIEGQL
ncbi:MAG: hypothetical protein ACTSSH_07035 [Candidatus Heimdallarchaeota archaeon]